MDIGSVKARKAMIDRKSNISIRRQCALLSVARNRLDSSVRSERLEDLEMMRLLDERYLEKPSHGVLPMQDYLPEKGYKVNEKKVDGYLSVLTAQPYHYQS
jgi:putative transposase